MWSDMPALTATLVVLGFTLAPFGFVQMCVEHPLECTPTNGASVAPFALVDSVNRRVNAAIRPEAEPSGSDVWQLGAVAGDCEDYAIAKRDLLLRAGVSSSSVRIATGWVSSSEYHAVLVVETTSGELVMDNLTSELWPVGRARVSLDRMQSTGDPRLWVSVSAAVTTRTAGLESFMRRD